MTDKSRWEHETALTAPGGGRERGPEKGRRERGEEKNKGRARRGGERGKRK